LGLKLLEMRLVARRDRSNMNRIVGNDGYQDKTEAKNDRKRDNHRDNLGDPVASQLDSAHQPAEDINQVNREKRYYQRNKKIPAQA
jgi:hypothetical protein